MKRINNSNIFILLLVAMGFILVAACNKSTDGNVVDASKRRSFTPSNLKIYTNKDSVRFTWTAPLFAISNMTYTVDIASDTNFSKIVYSFVSDTTVAIATDANIPLNKPYYARVRVNPYTVLAASNNSITTGPFKLNGLQYLKAVRDFEITQSSVLLHWYVNSLTSTATSIVLTPSDSSGAITVPLSIGDGMAGLKSITGLNASKHYFIQLFANKKSMGFTNFSTPRVVNFTTTISAGVDDLAATIAAASSGDVIGLNPGVYTLDTSVQIINKTISIRSVSNNPTDTKIISPEFDLVGDYAGLTLAGVEVNRNYNDTVNGNSFIQLMGSTAVSSPSTFNFITIDNCIIHDYKRCIIKGNNAAVANDFKIGSIVINNSQIYNVDTANLTGSYTFSLERLQFNSFLFRNSTFYNLGQGLINMSAALGTLTTLPNVSIDYCTFNNIGGNNKYLLIDANTNAVNFILDNSILANTPIKGGVNIKPFRASASSSLDFSFNNIFKFSSTIGGLDLILTGLIQSNNINVDLGWQPTTNNFSLSSLPPSNPIFTAGSSGVTIGDLRWAY